MKKHLANIVTFSRIIAAIGLFFFTTVSGHFIAVYSYCGFSDFIDGPIARKTNSSSLLGARLDTIGDVLTYLALAKILFLESLIPFWVILWFAVSVIGFITSAVISKVRHGQFYFVHSLFGKILGGCLFLLPFAIKLINGLICMGIVCMVSSIAAGESVFIQLKSADAQPDVLSIKKISKK